MNETLITRSRAREFELKTYFTEAFRQVNRKLETPEIQVTFYPFAGLNHTIRLRRQRIYVRISDLFRDAPPQVQRALAYILMAKLYKKRVRAEYQTLYRKYEYQPQVLMASEHARRSRGRKVLTGAEGQHYDLNQLFGRLNRRYFDGMLVTPSLSWSQRRTKRVLGRHDGAHEAIVISRSLDRGDLPEFVIEYVLYHEMLHMKHRPQLLDGRRIYHTPAFKADERRFERYEQAIALLDRLG